MVESNNLSYSYWFRDIGSIWAGRMYEPTKRWRSVYIDSFFVITHTCLCHVNPLNTRLLYSKTGVYRGIHFLVQNKDCGYSLEPSQQGGSNVYSQSILRNKEFALKTFNFAATKSLFRKVQFLFYYDHKSLS